jgi:tape measure domain-containing protein
MADRIVEEIILKLSIDDKGATNKISNLSGDLDKSSKSASNLTGNMLKLGASLLAAAGGIAAIGKASDMALDFTKVGNVLGTVFGESEQVRKEWEFLNRVAETLGLNVLDLTDGYAKIAAAAKGTSLEGRDARNVLVGVATASTALSLSADQTKGAILALNQIISKGKVQAEELRGQLGERIPGAFQIAARSVGVTTQALDKMLETGQLLAKDFVPKFAAQLKKEFSGGALKAAQKEVAELNRISNEVNETWRQFGVVANSFIPFIANTIIPSVTDAFESLLDTSLDFAEKALPEILTVANGVFSGLGTLINSFGEVAGSIFSFIGQGWNLLFTEITGDSNWVDSITGFLTVAAQAWPQLITTPFLTIGKIISDMLASVQRGFQKTLFAIQTESLIAANALGALSDEELEAGIIDIGDKEAQSRRTPVFFEDLAQEQQRLLDENSETIKSFAEAAEDRRVEEKKNFKELIDDIRGKIKNVFDQDLKKRGKDEKQEQRDLPEKPKKFAGPITTAFEVGTADASSFLKGTSVQLEQLDVQKQIEKNTRNATNVSLIAKGAT